MAASLASIMSNYPLPESWQLVESHLDEVTVCGLGLRRAGLAARRCGDRGDAVAVGAACELGDDPAPRAFFELRERAAVLDAFARPKDCRFALLDRTGRTIGQLSRATVFPVDADCPRRASISNGCAIFGDFQGCCERAAFERIERDRVLRAWAGEVPFVEVDEVVLSSEVRQVVAELSSAYELYIRRAVETEPRSGRLEKIEVVTMAAVGRVPTRPLLLGYGVGRSTDSAVRHAGRELLQQLGFLWGEPVADTVEVTATPAFHRDYYQRPDHQKYIRDWLKNAIPADQAPCWAHSSEETSFFEFDFVDIGDRHAAEQGLCMIKALHPGLKALEFGAPESGKPHPIA